MNSFITGSHLCGTENRNGVTRARGRAAAVWEDMGSGQLTLQDSGLSACVFGGFLVAKKILSDLS